MHDVKNTIYERDYYMETKRLIENLQDLIPPKIRKKAKQWLKKQNNNPADNIVLRSGDWVARKSNRFIARFYPDAPHTLSGNFKRIHPVTAVSRAKDFFINKQAGSRRYSFQLPLIIMNPYGYTPLTALAVFTTKHPCRIRCRVPSREGIKDICTTSPEQTAHRVPILGLYPDSTNMVTLEMLTEDDTVSGTITFPLKAPNVPASLRGVVKVQKHTANSSFPLILVNGGTTDFPYAFDEAGDIRYVLTCPTKTYGLYLLSGGKFLQQPPDIVEPSYSNPHAVMLNEMDYIGRVYRTYYVPHGTHHDVQEMTPGGNILAAYSTLDACLENSVIEIDRETGEILKHVDLCPLLEQAPHSIVDWIHVNSVSYNADSHTVLVNSRNLHTVILLDWETGEVKWLLGNPAFWKGTNMEDKLLTFTDPDMPWFFQAHSAYFLPNRADENPDVKQMIIFDNHWQKRTPIDFFDNSRKGSYVKFYRIDEKNRTVSFLKEFESLKTPLRSIGHYVPESHRVFVMAAYLEETTEDGCDGLIYEYDYETGTLYNKYGTFHSYFRAYNFVPQIETACTPMDYENRYTELGTSRQPVELKGLYISTSEPLPRFSKEEQEQRKRERIERENASRECTEPTRKPRVEMKKKQYRKKGGNSEYIPEKLKEHLCRIRIRRYGNYLLLYGKDHLISNVFFVGRQHTYQQTYTNTKQCLPEVFGEYVKYMAITTRTFEPDIYEIFIEVHDIIYKTKWEFTIR